MVTKLMQWSHESKRRWHSGATAEAGHQVSRGGATGGGSRTGTRGLAIGVCRRPGVVAGASSAPLVPPAAAANRDVPQGPATCPVPSAGLAEVAGLREAVVVEVTKLCVGGFTSWTLLLSFLHRYVGHPCPIRHRTGPDGPGGSATTESMRLRWRRLWWLYWLWKNKVRAGSSVVSLLLVIWLLQ